MTSSSSPAATDDSEARLAGLSRRRFLSGLGLIGVAAAGGQLASSLSSPAAAASKAARPATAPVANTSGASTAVTSGVLTTSGLYAGAWDYLNHRSALLSLGGTALRTTNTDMTAAGWAAMQADGQDTHVTISGTDRGKFSTDDLWIADYLAQVDTFLTSYPAKWVEIWNEPNFGMWAGASAAAKQLAYGKLLVAAYAHIKSCWPGVGVVGFGAGAMSAAAPGFIKGVFAAVPAAASAFDVCSLHPYYGNTAPDLPRTEAWGTWTIAGTVSSLRSAGITTPIWFTETGWAISKADGGTYSMSASSTVSPTLQAAYRVRMYVLAMKLGIARLNHMYVIDADAYNGGFFVGATARPQATAFAAQQAVIGSATSITPISEGPAYWAYLVTTPAGPVTVAWSDTSATATLPSTPGGKVVSASGGVSSGTISGNQHQTTLSPQPSYLATATTAANVARSLKS